jgi:hypothetical protein
MLKFRFLLLLAVFPFITLAAPAQADYTVMYCASGNNVNWDSFTISNSNPAAFETVSNCSKTDSYPDGDSSFLRIKTKGSGSVTSGKASFSWTAPANTSFTRIGAYTRESDMLSGWRHQIVAVNNDGDEKIFNNICPGCGSLGSSGYASTITYAPRSTAWGAERVPFKKAVIRLTCSSSCAQSPTTTVDANSFTFGATDLKNPDIEVTPTPVLSGDVVRGIQPITFSGTDLGSGISFGKVVVDGLVAETSEVNAECQTITRGESVYGINMTPCPESIDETTVELNTADFGDGQHEVKICLVDFSGNENCEVFTARWINNGPPPPLLTGYPKSPSEDLSPTFRFQGVSGTTFRCQINDRAAGVCSSPYQPKNLGYGQNVLRVFQIDPWGNSSPAAIYRWTISVYKCTLTRYKATLNQNGLTIKQKGIRKRIVRYRLFKMTGTIKGSKNRLYSWRRPTVPNKMVTYRIGKYGFQNGKLRKYINRTGRARLIVSVINEAKGCNRINLRNRTKVLKFTPKIEKSLGLRR